jgi:hydrogenase maturation factor
MLDSPSRLDPIAREASVANSLAMAALALARRFSAGATMWCVAPQWSTHAQHIAVEFVHPVIVGKRSLPAVQVDIPDPAAVLRLLARPGDILVVASSGYEPRAKDLMRRSEAWGLTRLWLGAGAPPSPHIADHTVWLECLEADTAARSGDIVLLYHLLWELTHVVFEHPGLLPEEPECLAEVCLTCSDDGRVAEVVRVNDGGIVDVIVSGIADKVDATLVHPVSVGDLLLVHAGIAITTLDGTGDR